MEQSKILEADILDIIFEGRNKQYGAYELRKTYNRRLVYALSAMLGVSLLVIAGSVLAGSGDNKRNVRVFVKDFELSSLNENKIKPPLPPPPPPPTKDPPK